jgi:hypothetical protein
VLGYIYMAGSRLGPGGGSERQRQGAGGAAGAPPSSFVKRKDANPSSAILVSRRQTGNPLLRFIKNVRWMFVEDMIPDYQVRKLLTLSLSLSLSLFSYERSHCSDPLYCLSMQLPSTMIYGYEYIAGSNCRVLVPFSQVPPSASAVHSL